LEVHFDMVQINKSSSNQELLQRDIKALILVISYPFQKSNAVLSNTESTKRMKRNQIVILFESLTFHITLYLVDMLFAQVVSGLLPYNWWQFVCFSFVWLSLNTIDGYSRTLFLNLWLSKMTMATSSANQ
uniref:7TM_GPCR_Srx domain-containing protein n=1 Tax=Heligmosomoides polygyrus TaxID=6339 RepID=A0A183F5V2_HELPZ